MPQILAPSGWLRDIKLGIFGRDLRESMVGKMEVSEPVCWQEQNEPTNMTYKFVDPAAFKWRLVTGFMQERKQENEKNPLEHHDYLPERHSQKNKTEAKCDCAPMPRQMPQTFGITPRNQFSALNRT